ncbi:methionyl-tRNA formyltransferase [bacterium]|nr:methionyl-tRNA formyltransferase [bacterium]
MSIKIVFCGTPAFADINLRYLIEHKCDIQAVVTMPDKKQGRGQVVRFSPVKQTALDNNIPVLQPLKATDLSFLDELRKFSPDLIVVAAYGKILRKNFIDIPKFGCVNVHASLLPKYRGASPIHYALMNGDKETGVTTFLIDEGMDTGDIIFENRVPIDDEDTLGSLHDKLARVGAITLLKTIQAFEAGKVFTYPQGNGESVTTQKITAGVSTIDWSRSAVDIHNLVRAMNPVPGAKTTIELNNKMKIIKILRTKIVENKKERCDGCIISVNKDHFTVACGYKALTVLNVQLAGKSAMSAGDFMRGHHIQKGAFLGI